jgi:hypothetical protein
VVKKEIDFAKLAEVCKSFTNKLDFSAYAREKYDMRTDDARLFYTAQKSNDNAMMSEIIRVIKSHMVNDEIQRKLFDEDMAKAGVQREKMIEDISNISRAVQEIRDVLKSEKAKT